jgi:hypothetical protein
MIKIHKFLFIFITLILSLLPVYSYSSTPGSIRISLIDGNVQIKPEDTSVWVPASINTPLLEGDELWVPEGGVVELQLKDGSYVRLNENSSLQILRIDNNSFQFYLTTGHAYMNFRGLRDSLLQMDTPVSSIRAYDRSKFRIDVSDDGYTGVSVLNGAVYAENRNGRTRVSTGKNLSIGEDLFAELSPLGPSDEWERWNRERDSKLVEGRYSQRYLPDDLDVYAYDFDENGKWLYTRDYGYVWTPTVIVSAGWTPYRIGRWVWIGSDYVWVSYEPWGWIPYHYGRWTYLVSTGWVWVPPVRGAVYWGPGFVGWVYTPSYVAWVPLAPGDIYYGYGYYGPNSVNIININVNKIVIKKVYKNVYVNNAVTVINHDTFMRGKYLYERPGENPFLTNKINIGRPRIKPETSAFFPIIKEIPKPERPPQSIHDIKIRELKRERPLARQKNASVMRPESPQKTMPIRTLKEPTGLKTKLYREKESAPNRQIQQGKQKFVPQRQIQPSEKQKSEGIIIERQRKTMEPSQEKKQGRSVEPMEKGTSTVKGKKQIQHNERQQSLERVTTERQRKLKEPLMEKQKGKAPESTNARSIRKPDERVPQKKDTHQENKKNKKDSDKEYKRQIQPSGKLQRPDVM